MDRSIKLGASAPGCSMLVAALSLTALSLPAPASAAEPADAGGFFFRDHWFDSAAAPGLIAAKRVRVNSAEAVVHPKRAGRPEMAGSGLVLIRAPEDLLQVARVFVYFELWGGHPGTAGKRLTLNGRSTYAIPEVGTAEGYLTHQYPLIPLRTTDLVTGLNAIQMACDQGTSFWGHFIVDNAAVRAVLLPAHPDLAAAGLAGFSAQVKATPAQAGREGIRLTTEIPAALAAKVAAVEYYGRYLGYDENGDGRPSDWHGYTKDRVPVAIVGKATAAPFAVTWDVHLLPGQYDMAVKAVIRFREPQGLAYETAPLTGLATPTRRAERVTIHPVANLPVNFWSRASRKKTATIDVDVDPKSIVEAELHVVTWDGGAGTIKEPFKLNGHPFTVVTGAARHDVLYMRHKVSPRQLRLGANSIELLSDTEHHGIEMLNPGPVLIVRSRR